MFGAFERMSVRRVRDSQSRTNTRHPRAKTTCCSQSQRTTSRLPVSTIHSLTFGHLNAWALGEWETHSPKRTHGPQWTRRHASVNRYEPPVRSKQPTSAPTYYPKRTQLWGDCVRRLKLFSTCPEKDGLCLVQYFSISICPEKDGLLCSRRDEPQREALVLLPTRQSRKTHFCSRLEHPHTIYFLYRGVEVHKNQQELGKRSKRPSFWSFFSLKMTLH